MKIVTTGGQVNVFPLSFKDVTVMLGVVHLIDPGRESALQSRLKDFQRRGFPLGLNTGKGKAANYEPEHVILIAVAFELLELGMTPERIVRLLSAAGDAIIQEIRRMCGASGPNWFKRLQTIMYFDPSGLSVLRMEDGETPEAERIVIGTPADLSRRLTKDPRIMARIAVVDFVALVLNIIEGVSVAKGVEAQAVIDALVSDWALGK